jgi:hypothetical protein
MGCYSLRGLGTGNSPGVPQACIHAFVVPGDGFAGALKICQPARVVRRLGSLGQGTQDPGGSAPSAAPFRNLTSCES